MTPSETVLKLVRNCSETVLKLVEILWNWSETVPTLLWNWSKHYETVLKLLWHCSETGQKLVETFWHCSETVLELFWNWTQTGWNRMKLFWNWSESGMDLFWKWSESWKIRDTSSYFWIAGAEKPAASKIDPCPCSLRKSDTAGQYSYRELLASKCTYKICQMPILRAVSPQFNKCEQHAATVATNNI